MAKRTAALVAAMTILFTGRAGASTPARWPCGPVTVSIEAGPWHDLAVLKVAALTEASGREWRVVDDHADVTIRWVHPYEPGAAGVSALYGTAVEMTQAEVDIDPAVPSRWMPRTILHELGHVAGIDHVRVPRSVMSETDQTPYRDYQPRDVRALRSVGCG